MPNLDEMKKRLKNICDKCDTGPDLLDKLYKTYFIHADNPVVVNTINLLSSYKEEIKFFNEIIENVDPSFYKKWVTLKKPLIIVTPKELTSLRMYPNITLEGVPVSSIIDVSILDASNVLKSFIADYEEDMKSVGRAERWATPDRIKGRIEQNIDASTSKILTKILENILKPDEIRDLAAKIDIARKPLELTFAETPEDFSIMYGSGPSSCMSSAASGREAWRFLTDKKMCPPSFYGYFPYTKGAYIMKAGKVAARTVIFKKSSTIRGVETEKWFHGRVYSIAPDMEKKLRDALKSNEIMPLDGGFAPPIGSSFTIPGIPMGDGSYGIPFPFFDNMDYYGKGFFATFDAESHDFTLTYNKEAGHKAVPINGRGGYLKSTDYVQKKCEQCGRVTSGIGGWITTNDGHLYCSEACTKQKGYILVLQGNGHPAWQQLEPEMVQDIGSKAWFTNIKAARDNGFYPVIQESGVIPEETDGIVARGANIQSGITGITYYDPANTGYELRETIPLEIVDAPKNIQYAEEAPLFEEAA